MEDRLYREINLEYQRLRDRKSRELEERKEEIFSALPTLQELEEEISRLGFLAVKEQLTGNYENINSYKQEIQALGEMKKQILLEAGLPDHYLEMEYQCLKCEDTGYLPSGNRCDCFKQKLATRLYNMSNLQYVLEKENFNSFQIEVFSNEIVKEEGISPKENMTFILDVVEQFLNNFSKQNDENLLFYGATGLGKTYLSNCIAKELLDQGYTVIYQTAFTFLDILESRKFYREERQDSELAYRLLFDSDLLIIDDLGTEVSNRFTTSEIFNIVNTRLLRGKKTIISTNLSPMELTKTYSDRTFSRIFQKFMPLKFIGKDLRWEI